MLSTYHTTEGIVIKKTPYKEADFLVRVLARDFGKIDLRVRGARKHNSKLNSHLDFLDQAHISFVKNGDHIPTIIDAEKILSSVHWFGTKNSFPEAVKIARAIDLIIPLEVKDVKLFFLLRHFFGGFYEKSGEAFARRVILHEGYGKAIALPAHAQDFIMNIWPALKN